MIRATVVAFFLLFTFGCSSKPAPPEDVDKAAGQFFERLKAADYRTIYNDSSEYFKQQNSQGQVEQNLKQLAALGRLMEYRRLSMTFDKEGKNELALPVYSYITDTTRAELTFKFIDEGGEWKLLGFRLNQRPMPQ